MLGRRNSSNLPFWAAPGKRVAGRSKTAAGEHTDFKSRAGALGETLRQLAPRPQTAGWAAVGVAGLALLAGAAMVTIYNLPVFAITDVEVSGAQVVRAQDVVSSANLAGRHILRVSDQAVADSLAALPRVKSVSITRQLPSTVALAIEERKPWAVWQTGNSSYIIDDEGVVLETAPASHTLPVMAYAGNAAVKPGTRVPSEPVSLALRIDRVLPAEVKAKAKRFEYSESGGLLVVTDQGWQARFGGSDDLEYKIAVLRAIIQNAKAKNTKFTAVDLRFGHRPFIR